MAAGVAHIPYYATVLRGDELAPLLAEFGPLSRRYGGTSWTVRRSTEDQYKFLVMIGFNDKSEWNAFWAGPEMQRMRARVSGLHQVPVYYEWFETVSDGPNDLSPEDQANQPILANRA